MGTEAREAQNDTAEPMTDAGQEAASPPLPEQHDFYKMPAKFGHVPVAEEPLGWDPKRRFEHLYPRVSLPTQVVDRIELGSPELAPNRLFFGDNLHVMRSLPSESIDLIYIDPPFFSQKHYAVLFGDQNELRSFKDIWEGGLNGYLVWLNARLYEMKRLLTETGSILVHLDWHASHYVKVELDKVFGYSQFVNEIVWYYTGAGTPKDRFARRHDTILWYARGQEWTFNVDPLRTEYAAATQERFAHHIGNVRKGGDFGLQELHPEGKHPDDVLQVSIIAPSAKERIGYPTQKPEALLRKLVEGLSRKGDVVADFFCGGGTTPTVAQDLSRRWCACDISRVAVSITADRVGKVVEGKQEELKNSGKSVTVPDIEIAHWGVYEVSNLSKMSNDDFHEFVLAAFEARVDSTDTLIHGYKGKEPVNVGPPDPEVAVHKEQVAEFANAVMARRGSGGAGTMIAWAFSPAAKAMAERIEAQKKLKLQFVKLRLLPLESPEFAAHITAKHDRYTDLLSFVLPPTVRISREKVGNRKYRFDASESIALNSGAKVINAQWDFDYRGYFTSTAGFEMQRTKKGEPMLSAEYEFPSAGEHRIAVRVQDDLGGEQTHLETIEVS